MKGLFKGLCIIALGLFLTGCGDEDPNVEVADTPEDIEAVYENEETVPEEYEEEETEYLSEDDFNTMVEIVKPLFAGLDVEGDYSENEINITFDTDTGQSISNIFGVPASINIWQDIVDALLEITNELDSIFDNTTFNVFNPYDANRDLLLSIVGGEVTYNAWDEAISSAQLWNRDFFVDDFGDATDIEYIHNIVPIQGTFTNSATTDGDGGLLVVIGDGEVAFQLMTGRSVFQNSSSRNNQYFEITMRTESGDNVLTGFIGTSGDRLVFNENDPILNALVNYDEVMFHIVDINRPVTTFLFTVETGNFAEVFADFDF